MHSLQAAIHRSGRTVRRVLVVGADTTDSIGDSYRRALSGHYEVKVFNPGTATGRSISKKMWWSSSLPRRAMTRASGILLSDALALSFPMLLRVARDFAPDVVLVVPIAELPPHIVAGLRGGNRDAVVIGVYPDHLANFGRGYFFAADYDAIFLKDRFVVEKLRKTLSWKHIFYLPQACDPALHHPVELSAGDRARYGCDITIAGNIHYYRAARLAPLVGRDFKMWGPAPPRWLDHPIKKQMQMHIVTGEEKCKAMTAARIVLNENYYAEIAGTNKRTFEVAAMGAFQLTDTPALADVFDPETEVAAFESQADMLDKIDFYLARPELRDAMAKRACERAHREHTYAHRWTAKMITLGLDVPQSFPVQPSDVIVRAA